MAMTDGHLYFDSEEYFAGRRPPINIFLSVTRVGRQTQPSLFQDTGYELLKLLKQYEYTKQFLRFETELSQNIRQTLQRGTELMIFFNQIGYLSIAPHVAVYVVALIFLGHYQQTKVEDYVKKYEQNKTFRQSLDHLAETAKTLTEFIGLVEKKLI